jgi:CBS domain-containing protein
MVRDVVAVAPGLPLEEVAALLESREIAGLPVVAHGAVVGVISQRDLEARSGGRRRLTAGDVMSSPAVTIEPTAAVADAASVMSEAGVNRLPVVAEGTLVGIVTRADVVRAVGRGFRTERSRLAVGDRISVVSSGHSPGDRNGAGEVLEVVGRPGREAYRVRWLDGLETVYRPGRDALVLPG